MQRQYTFALTAIAQGRTVLIYKGVTARSAKHVKTSDRLAMIGGMMHCDGKSCAGLTVALKPEKWK